MLHRSYLCGGEFSVLRLQRRLEQLVQRLGLSKTKGEGNEIGCECRKRRTARDGEALAEGDAMIHRTAHDRCPHVGIGVVFGGEFAEHLAHFFGSGPFTDGDGELHANLHVRILRKLGDF